MKKNEGLAGIDMLIAIIAIIIFSTLILVLITNNSIENVKLAKETMAMIYITEIFENIAIEEYDQVIQDNVNNFIPQDALENYEVEINIQTDFEEIEEEQDIMKKINVTLTYMVGDKNYTCSMERLKIKE